MHKRNVIMKMIKTDYDTMHPMTWKRVDEERFDYMLECLPPIDWNSKGFLVGEAWSTIQGEEAYCAFFSHNGDYYESQYPLTRNMWKNITIDDVLENEDES